MKNHGYHYDGDKTRTREKKFSITGGKIPRNQTHGNQDMNFFSDLGGLVKCIVLDCTCLLEWLLLSASDAIEK